MQFDKGFLHLLIAKTLLDLGEEDKAISFLKRAVLADSKMITLLISQTQNDSYISNIDSPLKYHLS